MTTTFIDQTVKSIDQRLQAALEEQGRLRAARNALTGTQAADLAERPASDSAPRALTARQTQALALIDAEPGISTAKLSRALGGTYGWAAAKRLAALGRIEQHEGGWKAV